MGNLVNVLKASGEIESFSERKVIGSLVRAGADLPLAQQICAEVKPHLYQNIPSTEVYGMIMKILKREKKDLAEKYNLKRSIMELGPTGYPFEKFMAEILKAQKHEVLINQIIQGKCISHEVDIIAKNQEKFMIECKFHNQIGGRTDVKVALYVYARFLDVKEKGFDRPWLITNTKVTQEVKTYALCVGMKVTAWDYPEGESLREMIDQTGLYPITASVSLTLLQKQNLIEQGIVFYHDYSKIKK